MRFLVDANILLDVLQAREPHLEKSSLIWKLCETGKTEGYVSALTFANLVWKLCETGKAEGYVSALTFANLVYVMRRELSPEGIKQTLDKLLLIFRFADLSEAEIPDSGAVEYYCVDRRSCAVSVKRLNEKGRTMDTYETIITRRSSRKYKQTPVTREKLEKVLEAGRRAACGGNNQTTHFIVVEKKAVLDELAIIAREEFAKMEIREEMYSGLKNSINASKRGNYVFHYNAPTLIITANKIGYGNNIADCACAIENMMLEANELNLGSCWINQLHWLENNPRMREYVLKLGMAEDETICASMILGYPDTKDGLPNRKERKITGNPITYIE